MAEFCRDCFIETFRPPADEVSRIVMTKESDLCEGCGAWKPVVSYIRPKTVVDRMIESWKKERKKK